MSDGERSYESLFASIFLRALPSGAQGRQRALSEDSLSYQKEPGSPAANLKRREGGRVVEMISRVAHGSWKRVHRELEKLGYEAPNLSAVERQNGTSRRMNSYLVRKSLAFARKEESREALG